MTGGPGDGPMAMGSQRCLFDVPGEVAYFNTANMSPLLASVREAGEAAPDRRGAPWSISSADWFTEVELLRTPFAELVDTDPDSGRVGAGLPALA